MCNYSNALYTTAGQGQTTTYNCGRETRLLAFLGSKIKLKKHLWLYK